ncbi:NADH dehydrogenase [ubiquinone] 1 alpha subcomplex subunit 10, mitochondrial [Rhipicephalus sanguineus]|uniref:NADH dehydrogenase [ubiquinone] 1 alpha subcomplex subunit 10, mitochondrial n=1 Tax=Rhipicephalus sanguineus TaxID=34632 RepID=UPI001895961D|nr:NADH dehydrogenase [ubiquinone] 1 alpha subcomplex subunit 10, mitochondrial [Rhipicephalus sanguineus]XP_049269408.1 NADH dehydrogenase [ubiquinone] 1 alpha subcomplex subunit 10, mitochondrial [Rhipicephalus sanguineus]XP_049269409.1 NADH dehydrogenase [ubiquinone] 1 alpha subcomplex subunit 10, mitochondrial [Rhipicephalus sanguineus]
MAFSLLRISRCIAVVPGLPTSCNVAVARSTVHMQQVAGMKTRAFRERVPKPKPFPYETKEYKSWRSLFDETLSRFDENTRLIVVEGNIGSGKSALAKTIAEEFELKHVPEVCLDNFYVDDYGFDYRSVNNLLPESCRMFDMKQFYQDPHNIVVAKMQMLIYTLRFEQYVDALVHIMNTGQGVVLERSCYSDVVFASAMHKFGYISPKALKMYHKCRKYTLFQLLKPHLVIYLDVPSDILLQRIRERNRPEEVNSKVLTKAYLDEIESGYKKDYLRSIRKETELLMYDWSHFGDAEMVLDDIEHIDFEGYLDDPYGPMMADWKKKPDLWEWYRYRMTAEKDEVMGSIAMDLFEAPELATSGEDQQVTEDIMEKFNNKRQYFMKVTTGS